MYKEILQNALSPDKFSSAFKWMLEHLLLSWHKDRKLGIKLSTYPVLL
jgi:hypothetical protein